MLQFAAEYLGWIVAIVGAVGTLGVVMQRGGKHVHHLYTKVNDVSDVLLGREEIRHPETGEVLAPAAPGIGARMATMERWAEETGHVLNKLADTQAELRRTNTRVDRLSDDLREHILRPHP